MNQIYCLGDSLTEGDYGIPGKSGIANVQPENYPYFLSQLLPEARVHNLGKCGYTATSYLRFYQQGNVNVRDADVIIIMLGTNGGLDPIANTEGNRDFRALLRLCRHDAPQARLILCTPPHATRNPACSNWGYANQVEKAVAFVRQLAGEAGTELIDTARCPDFTPENEAEMQPNDGLHFGRKGYETLAKFIAARL